MNKKAVSQKEVLERFRAWLPRDWEVRWLPFRATRPWDAILELPKQDLRLGIIVRRDPRFREFPFGANEEVESSLIPVLAAPRVPPRLQEVLRERGWGWLDEAGNGWISLPGRLLIERSGRWGEKEHREAAFDSLHALQVVRILLHPENAGVSWTLRELQSECARPEVGNSPQSAPSLGYLSRLTSALITDAYLERASARSPICLRDPRALIAAAARSYSIERIEAFSIKPRGALSAGLKQISRASGGLVAWAAFTAADFQAPAVGEKRHWIIVPPRNLDMLMDTLGAKEVDGGANLVILLPPNDAPFYKSEEVEPNLHCTNPVQTYWDLRAGEGRGEEAAEELLERRLIPAWKGNGSGK